MVATVYATAVRAEINIDFAASAGRIKPLHAVNNAPLRIGRSLKEFRIAGIPYMRTHDTVGMWGWGHFIDVPNIHCASLCDGTHIPFRNLPC